MRAHVSVCFLDVHCPGFELTRAAPTCRRRRWRRGACRCWCGCCTRCAVSHCVSLAVSPTVSRTASLAVSLPLCLPSCLSLMHRLPSCLSGAPHAAGRQGGAALGPGSRARALALLAAGAHRGSGCGRALRHERASLRLCASPPKQGCWEACHALLAAGCRRAPRQWMRARSPS